MVLFVSDIHFGRGDYAEERAKEDALLACLRAHEEDIEHLYLVGDVFDAFIEYRTLIPKGFVRFLGLLAAWTDGGMPVTYLVGNHDPWHLDYFRRELGVYVVPSSFTEHLHGHRVYLEHGDGIHRAERWYRLFRPVLRHPLAARLYRELLPGDGGLRLARWVSRRGEAELDAEKAADLRVHAHRLVQTEDVDVVVMGHSHQAEHQSWSEGCYLNLGTWAEGRTFGTLDEDGPKLWRWNGNCRVRVENRSHSSR